MQLRTTKVNNPQLVTGTPPSKGKWLLAGCLIMVMVLLWMRFFLSKDSNPVQTAGAAVTQSPDKPDPQKADHRLVSVQLPFIESRHNAIQRDIFAPIGWHPFQDSRNAKSLNNPTQKEKTLDQQEEMWNEIIDNVIVRAILIGPSEDSPRAFINDSIVSIGQKVKIPYEGQIYSIKVADITRNTVLLQQADKKYTINLSGSEPEKNK